MATLYNVLGIDLGTTNSVATVYTDSGLKHIPFDNDYLLPSVVNISDNGVIVGAKAKNMAMIAIENTAISIKRVMGSDEVITLNNKNFTPQEISSFIIKKIVETATAEIGESFTQCVVTVPAYFNEKQREATREAVLLANLEPIRIINEPTAAAISYGADKNDDMVYAVYDLGGGTFDISIIENSQGLIEVVSTMGDNNLGGDDFDQKLAQLIIAKSDLDIEVTTSLNIKLLQIAQDVKVQLSKEDEVVIDEKFFTKVDGVAKHLEVTVTKEEFESLIEEDIDKTISLLEEAIEESEYDIDEIESIILTGGSSKIPLVSQKILEQTQKLPILIEDPDKSVSIGAILQAAMIKGVDTESILIDITPYSLGTMVREDDGRLVLSRIIFKNSPVPSSKTSRYYAAVPFQSAYELTVFQGEDEENLSNNVKIGSMMLELENPVEDGEVDVSFNLDQNGMLSVIGREVSTKEEVNGVFKTTITKSSNHKKISQMGILNEHENSIVMKIDELLSNKDILDEDKADLKTLKTKYLNVGDGEKAEIEEEIIDTIFFLEQ
ncbi:MAG: Hsp70 family protein [Campylobacterota bacterium]|nr:Hsp70 family protein [Campylobacterota bacterium]